METRIVKPKNVPDRFDSYAFLKFYSEEKYVDSLRKGILYMRSKEIFSKIDKEGMGDFLENKAIVALPTHQKKPEIRFQEINGELYVLLSETEKKGNNDSGIFMLHDRNAKRHKIFCLYTLWYDKKTGDIFNFDESIKRDFGEYCCFIYRPNEFLARVCQQEIQHLNELKDFYAGFVEYYDISNSAVHDWHPFRKDSKQYSHQNEFRLMILTDDEGDELFYNMSNLKDISIKTTFDYILSSFKVENGHIYLRCISD